MTEAEKMVFEGVKETRYGIQYVMSDRLSALLAIGKHLGLSEKSKEESVDRFGQMLREISERGSSMPIRSAPVIPAYDDDENDEVDP